jgi:hypothetical protein
MDGAEPGGQMIDWAIVAIFGFFFFIAVFILICLSRMAKAPGEKEFKEYENRMLRRHLEKINR